MQVNYFYSFPDCNGRPFFQEKFHGVKSNSFLSPPTRPIILGSLSKPRRPQQRERHQTKGLMSRIIALHVRYKSLYISFPSSAKFFVVYRTWTTTPNFSYFHLELNAVVTYLANRTDLDIREFHL